MTKPEIASRPVQVVDQAGSVIFTFDVEAGDIWRACQTKDIAVRDWVKLAVTRPTDRHPGDLLA